MSITTRLTGEGHYANGSLTVWPVTPWVVYDGQYTRPMAKRLLIINKKLYELDGTTPASLAPSYVSGGGVIVYPNNNYYGFEIFQRGRRAAKGFLKVPYDPTDQGKEWFDFDLTAQRPTFPTQIGPLDSVKIYPTLAARNADSANILPGTILFVEEDTGFYGKTSSTFVLLYNTSGVGSVADGILFGDTLTDAATTAASVADGVVWSDSVLASTSTFFAKSITDGLVLGDSTSYTFAGTVSASVTDKILFGIQTINTITTYLFETEGIIFGDSVTGTLVTNLVGSLSDGLVLSEDITTVTTEVFAGEVIKLGDTTDAVIT